MSGLLALVFVVEASVHIVNAVGAATINNLLWAALNALPISTSQAAGEKRALQAEFLKVRADLNATSSQDEFAKWAKLRRQHDKLLEQLEAKKKSMEATRVRFDNYLTAVRLILTRAPQYIIPFWFAKEPMFWLPHGWFPYYAEWIISFPRAPLGSVSIASWQLACTGLLGLLSELVAGIVGVVRSYSSSQKQAVPVPAGNKATSKSSEKTKTEASTEAKTENEDTIKEKKEL